MKIKKIGHRGTEAHESEIGTQNWAGDKYRNFQVERIKKIPKNLTMHLGRGIRTTKAKDLPEPLPRPSTKGKIRVTNRGTGTRYSKNTGSPVI